VAREELGAAPHVPLLPVVPQPGEMLEVHARKCHLITFSHYIIRPPGTRPER